ncbi:hypothetical protein CTAYLR_002486 [Chrysophaeum taylorii]|uniref:Ammonium transporter AmtB-like domain-containing protein n=1 Tax=Chrysophaeum taylorii TaxID=2483200 RepID=A0AAD7UH67_9STRA|nr:hypothetical protein CTAYLR_002486 [Chrysophaeum taylorii]
MADQDEASTYLTVEDGDAFWLIFGTVLVFFMQAGFAMMEAGSVDTDRIGRVLLKNIFDTSIAAIMWWLCGFAFANGTDAFKRTGLNGFIGGSGFMYENEGSGEDASPLTGTSFGKTYNKALWQFQWAFAGVAATIVSGAVGGRCTLEAYLAYTTLLSGIVYPVIVHMTWDEDGFFSTHREGRLLLGCGVVDFAGSGVVHLTGGCAALCVLPCLSSRRGRFATTDEEARDFVEPHSLGIVFRALGAFILWFGWFGFNGVSTITLAHNAGLAAHAMMNTTLAATASCCLTAAISNIHKARGRVDVALSSDIDDTNYPVNGIIAGLVAITAGCAVVTHWGALCVGALAAGCYYGSSRLLISCGIDDVVDAIPIHASCGTLGVVATAFFATEYYYKLAVDPDPARAKRCRGVFYGGNGASLVAALAYILTIVAWVVATIGFAFSILHKCLKLVDWDRYAEKVSRFRCCLIRPKSRADLW